MFVWIRISLKCAQEHGTQQVTEEEWEELTRGKLSRHPMPVEYLDRVYRETKAKLEESAGEELTINVDIVLFGSPIQSYSVGCLCPQGVRGNRQYCYYDRVLQITRCYCPGIEC